MVELVHRGSGGSTTAGLESRAGDGATRSAEQKARVPEANPVCVLRPTAPPHNAEDYRGSM